MALYLLCTTTVVEIRNSKDVFEIICQLYFFLVQSYARASQCRALWCLFQCVLLCACRAHERGVKLIGATAHFATSELDCGPIIAQDTVQVSHRDSVADMVRKGRDLERLVLARALRWSVEDRILVTNDFGKTVIFEDWWTSSTNKEWIVKGLTEWCWRECKAALLSMHKLRLSFTCWDSVYNLTGVAELCNRWVS